MDAFFDLTLFLFTPSGNGIGGRRRITEIFLRTTEMSGRAEEDSSDRMTTADDLDLPPV